MKDLLVQDLNKLLRRLSRPQITTWIDSDALRIIENKYKDVQIAEIIYHQYGKYSLLKKIRLIYVNTYTLEELNKLGLLCGFRHSLDRNYFTKFQVFVKIFSLSVHWEDSIKKDYNNIGEICLEYGSSLVSSGMPHYYQKAVKNYCIDWFLRKSQFTKALVSMPTGSGKTRMANEFIIDLFRSNQVKRVLWLAHRRELLYQTAKSFENLYLEKGDSCIRVDFNFDIHSNWFGDSDVNQVVYSSFDKISAEQQVQNQKIDLVIIDEAHFTMAETYSQIVSNIVTANDSRLFGLTATPMRANDELFLNLLNFYQYKISLKDVLGAEDTLRLLQDNGYLAQINYEYLNIPSQEFHQNSEILNEGIVNKCRVFRDQKKNVLIFAMSKSHAIAINSILNLEGIESSCIVGETPFTDREEVMVKFKNKSITALVNYDILTTGVDIPRMDGIIVLRRFNERHTAIQVIGRALRGPKNGGNPFNTVIFVNEIESKDINHLYNY
jgi:DNA repair protein RadD